MFPTTIKFCYNEQWRRFSIDWPSQDKYAHLIQVTKEILGLPSDHALLLQYKDNEKDLITIGGEKELIEAFKFASDEVLKIHAADKENNQLPGYQPELFGATASDGDPAVLNGVLQVYKEQEAKPEHQPEMPSPTKHWRQFSNQEKFAVRQTLHAANDVFELFKPNPKMKVTRKPCPSDEEECCGGMWSLIQRPRGSENFVITREREGIGMNATTGQAFVHSLSAGFEIYLALTEND